MTANLLPTNLAAPDQPTHLLVAEWGFPRIWSA
jgi:hypothetical protein